MYLPCTCQPATQHDMPPYADKSVVHDSLQRFCYPANGSGPEPCICAPACMEDELRYILLLIYIFPTVSRSPAIDANCILDCLGLIRRSYHSAFLNEP